MEQLAHHRLYNSKHYSSTLIIEENSKKLQPEVTDPTVQHAEAKLSCSKQQDPHNGLRGLQINIPSASCSEMSQALTWEPRLLVDVHKEPTFKVGEVLL